MVKVCLYDNFRKGEKLFKQKQRVFGTDCFYYVKTITIDGFRMFNAFFEPVVVPGGMGDVIVADIIEMTSAAYYIMMDDQKRLGMYEDIICVDGEFIPIFLNQYPGRYVHKLNVIPDGNWKLSSENDFMEHDNFN